MAEPSNAMDIPTIFDPATCLRKGMCPVMGIRGQQETPLESHSVYFELHGTTGEKLLLIMGLNTSSFAWGQQVRHFAKTHQVLVLDNRGVGNSDSPKGPYTYVHRFRKIEIFQVGTDIVFSTSGLADDVIALLDYVGWNNGRELHIVGVSMGGMITQGMFPYRLENQS
jgi:pimeloyl-ACP methyl ester carboxylesterase